MAWKYWIEYMLENAGISFFCGWWNISFLDWRWKIDTSIALKYALIQECSNAQITLSKYIYRCPPWNVYFWRIFFKKIQAHLVDFSFLKQFSGNLSMAAVFVPFALAKPNSSLQSHVMVKLDVAATQWHLQKLPVMNLSFPLLSCNRPTDFLSPKQFAQPTLNFKKLLRSHFNKHAHEIITF